MTTTQETQAASPWHAGEVSLQQHVGVADQMARHGNRVIRQHLIDQHRDFYPLLPLVVLGAVEPNGDVWATLRSGEPGFMQAPTPHALDVAVARDFADPAERGMEDGDGIALLGIQLSTRRRNRLNGVVRRENTAGFSIGVEQSYGNCNQYIQLRDFTFTRDPATPTNQPVIESTSLDVRARQIIAEADTFFVASYVMLDSGQRQVDVSHRGGRRGFVHVDGAGVLTIPDFAGNLFFNTLGNFMVNGQGGLVFADFETGDLLQLTGEAEVILDSPEIAAFQGAERIWRFKPRRIVLRPAALPMRWDFKQGGWSPNSLMTGSWEEAESRLRAAALANAWRPFRVASVVVESATVRSYVLEPTDGAGIAGHLAGQHLPIRVHLPGESAPLIRTYTLSVAPSDGVYRISVKREGRVSSYLHEQVRVGDLIDTRKPAGNFTIDAAETRPAVLLAAGIGITPMLAMLRHVVYEGLRKRRIRSTRLFYSARSKAERAFDEEIDTIARAAQGMVDVTRVLSQTEGAVKDRDFDIGGRIDLDLLKVTLPFDDYDFYLCGPAGFMQDLYDGLRSLNVADERIHAESFGPASLRRSGQAETKVEHSTRPASKPVPVMFMQSGKEARWVPGDGSLLQLAEARGLAPEYSCREGTCGTCRTRILQGAVAYASPPGFRVPADEALICCAVPAEPQSGAHAALQLDL